MARDFSCPTEAELGVKSDKPAFFYRSRTFSGSARILILIAVWGNQFVNLMQHQEFFFIIMF